MRARGCKFDSLKRNHQSYFNLKAQANEARGVLLSTCAKRFAESLCRNQTWRFSTCNVSTCYSSLSSADGLRIMEQNYQYDLLNPSKLLDKYVGREVTLVLRRYENSTEVLTPVQATLLSNNSGQVWRIGGQIVINPSNIAEMRFPDLPQNLVATPTLVWD